LKDLAAVLNAVFNESQAVSTPFFNASNALSLAFLSSANFTLPSSILIA
jgi:hypothetical protein